MNKTLLFLILALSFLQAGPTITPEVKSLLNEAKLIVPSMSAEETLTLIQKGNVVLIDVRDPYEWEDGVIKAPKLVTISRGFLEVKYPGLILKDYKKNDTYIVYCGIEPRSILAASRLKALGFTNVSYLKGGIKNWDKVKHPLVKKN